MINIFITLGLLLVIQIYMIIYFTDKITDGNVDNKNYNKTLLKKFFEIALIIGTIYYTCKLYLKNKLSENVIEQIIIIIELIVILFWLYLNFIDKNDVDYNNNYLDELNNLNNLTSLLRNNNVNIPNNNNIISNSEDDDRIFSKYISKYDSDYKFEDLYPNYNTKKKDCDDSKTSPDLTKYDGYSTHHKCYNCSCLEGSDGIKECKKIINGIAWGCDPKWKCNNCKKCQDCDNLNIRQCNSTIGCKYQSGKCISDPAFTNDNLTELPKCNGCRCYNRNGVIKCQKVSKIDSGLLVDCDNDCTRCNPCKNDEDKEECSKKFKFLELKEDINRNNIVINNISEKDLNTIL